MNSSTVSSRRPQSCRISIVHAAAGLAFVFAGQTELGSINRTSAGYAAYIDGGTFLGTFDREYKAAASTKRPRRSRLNSHRSNH